MKTRRILSVVLALMMILPMAIMGISADDTATTPAPGTVLYENNFTTGFHDWKLISGGDYNYALTVKGKAAGDNYIQFTRLDMTSWGRTNLEIVSAEKLAAGVVDGKYSITLDAQWINATDNFYLYFGGDDSTTHLSGNILYINTSKKTYLSDHANQGSPNTTGQPLTDGVFNTIKLDIEIGAENATVDMYLNGTPVAENWVTKSYNLGAIGISLGKGSGQRNGCSEIALDNVSVTSGATTIYAEDFNDVPTTEQAVPGYMQGRSDNGNRGVGISATHGGEFFYNGKHDNNARFDEQWLIPDGYLGNATKYTITYDMYSPAITGSSSGAVYAVFGYGDGVTSLTDTKGAWVRVGFGNDSSVSVAHDYNVDKAATSSMANYPFNNKTVTVTIAVDLDEDVVTVTLTDGTNVLATVTNTNMSSLKVGGGLRIGSDYGAMYFIDNLRVVAGTPEDAPADYYGAQAALNTNGIRFVGTLGQKYTAENIETLREVGFHITATYAGGTKEFNQPCTTLYNTLTGGTETYTAENLGGEHIFAFTIKNIPAEVGVITFVVTPYFRTGAVESTGTTWTVVYDAATNTVISQTMN